MYGEHVRGPALFPVVVVIGAPITTVSPSIDTLTPNSSPAAPSVAFSLSTCVQLEASSPAVSRVNTYADPLLSSLVVVTVRPDHHRVAVDRHAVAELSYAAPSSRGQLGDLRPAGGEVAGRVARVHVRGPAVVSLVVVLQCAPITIVSPSIETLTPK